MRQIRDFQDYYKHTIASVTGNLKRRGDGYLAGVDAEELIEYYYSSYKLPKIVLVNDGKAKVIPDSPSTKNDISDSVPVSIRFDVEEEERTDVVLRLRIADSKDGASIVQCDQDGFFIRTNLLLQSAKEKLEEYGRIVSQLVARRNNEIETGNGLFRERISSIINEGKSRLKAQKDMIGQLSKIIPIVERTEPTSPIVPLAKQKQIIINPPRSRYSADPKIDPKILEAIIDVLARGGHTFETTPETFAKLDEGDLRNFLISFLNGTFELHAVAEAFNKLGKSDISLLYSGNNLFVAECKFWGGTELYAQTIDQLFRYLTWRENIGVLITFVREKDFTSIIRKAKEASCSHTTFASNSLNEKAASYFVTRHSFPEDKEKTVEIHHLLFTIHSPR
jgi:hypothetical protein